MSEEKPVVTRIWSYSMFIIIVIAILSLPILLLFDAGTIINDYKNLDNSQCQKIIINDTFSQIRGNFGSATYYYIVTSDNKIYELAVGRNSTKLYAWKTIVKGQEYSLQIYDEYAEFCGDIVLGVDK